MRPPSLGLGCAVLKLDTEGDGAASRAEFLELSGCGSNDSFFIGKGVMLEPWTTDQVVDSAIGSRRAAHFMLPRRSARR